MSKLNLWTEKLTIPKGNLLIGRDNLPPFLPKYSDTDVDITVLKYKTENMRLAGLNISISLLSGNFPSWNEEYQTVKDLYLNYYDTGIPFNGDIKYKSWSMIHFNQEKNIIQLIGPEANKSISSEDDTSNGVIAYFINTNFEIESVNSASNENANTKDFTIKIGNI